MQLLLTYGWLTYVPKHKWKFSSYLLHVNRCQQLLLLASGRSTCCCVQYSWSNSSDTVLDRLFAALLLLLLSLYCHCSRQRNAECFPVHSVPVAASRLHIYDPQLRGCSEYMATKKNIFNYSNKINRKFIIYYSGEGIHLINKRRRLMLKDAQYRTVHTLAMLQYSVLYLTPTVSQKIRILDIFPIKLS